MTQPLIIPEKFQKSVLAERGRAGAEWLSSLSYVVDNLCDQWDLTLDGLPMHGYVAIVIPVIRNKEKLVLKISWIDDETRYESLALKLWNGDGAVRIFEHAQEQGAMVLERLQETESLSNIGIEQSVEIAAKLLRRLAIEAPPEIPSTVRYAERQTANLLSRWAKLERPFSKAVIDVALDAATTVCIGQKKLLINQDMHYENVLRAQREPWLVIDPKPVAGDIEFGAAPLLWNRFEAGRVKRRLEILIDAADIDGGQCF